MDGIKTKQDWEDFVNGAALFGCGGGGTPAVGLELLASALQDGKLFGWESIDDFDDEEWLCTAWYMGSIAPPTEEEKNAMEERGQIQRQEPNFLARAVKELERELNVQFAGIIAEELGGINSPAPLAAAASLDKRFVDGDLVGRGVPEAAAIYPRVMGMPMCPVVCCDAWGNVCIIREAHGYDMAEALGKMLSIPAGEPIGLAGFAMQVKNAKKVVFKGTMTKVLAVGRSVRMAVEQDEDPALAFAGSAGGTVFFRGKVTQSSGESKNGYMFGTTYIEGSGEFAQDELKIWFKNENHIVWKNGIPCALSPDLVQIIDEKSGLAIMNDQLASGMQVAVIAIPHPIYRSKGGMKVLGPGHFGFTDILYQPVEELLDFTK